MLAALHSGSGKTVLTAALALAFRQQGIQTGIIKCGPDYIDPLLHNRVIKEASVGGRNLDFFLQGRTGITQRLAELSAGWDLMLLEGVMGFYDGMAAGTKNSSYDIAAATDTPVILILRPSGVGVTIAAQLKGICSFLPDNHITGVILNDCKQSLFTYLKPVIEKEAGLPVLGYLPPFPEACIESRHLGLKAVSVTDTADFDERFAFLSRKISETVDLTALYALCAQDPAENENDTAETGKNTFGVSVAVAYDEAFCFYYRLSLQALRKAGASLVFFSPLHDPALPEHISGLYLGGGYPELFVKELSDNVSMRESVYRAVSGGLPTIAECGGFLYLHRTMAAMEDRSRIYEMAGVIPGHAFYAGSLKRFGYVRLKGDQSMLFREGEAVPAHEFHYYDSTARGEDLLIEKASGTKSFRGGYTGPSLYAGFPHLELSGKDIDGGQTESLAERFVNCVRQYAETESRAEKQVRQRKEERKLFSLLSDIGPCDEAARQAAQDKWDSIAKPLGSLGAFESMIAEMAALTGNPEVQAEKPVLAVFCADNGVVKEGVSQSGHEVTLQVMKALAAQESTASFMAREVHCAVLPVDMGVMLPEDGPLRETDSVREALKDQLILNRRIRNGTGDILVEPAMEREECVQAILTGFSLAGALKEQGFDLLLSGEMGIGNTTTAAAVSAALLCGDPVRLTGRGAGLSDEMLERKRFVVKEALKRQSPTPHDAIDVLSGVGGLDLAGLCGFFLGGAYYRIPVLIDGYISAVAALCALRLCENAGKAMFASHLSGENGGASILRALQKRAVLQADMRLGEGSGALMLLAGLRPVLSVYNSGHDFASLGIPPYQRFEENEGAK